VHWPTRTSRLRATSVQKLLQAAPENPLVLQTAGALELESGSLAQAERHLSKALQFEPRLLAARRLLAQTYLRSGQACQGTGDPSATGRASERECRRARNCRGCPSAKRAAGRGGGAVQACRQARTRRHQDQDGTWPWLRSPRAMHQGGFAELESIAARDSGTYTDMALVSARLGRRTSTARCWHWTGCRSSSPPTPSPTTSAARSWFSARTLRPPAPASKRPPPWIPGTSRLWQAWWTWTSHDKKPEAAIARMEAELSREPRNYRALGILASLRQRTGAPPESIKALLTAAVKASPDQTARACC
jgi:tetratricopeptide (TPR) repeat protein